MRWCARQMVRCTAAGWRVRASSTPSGERWTESLRRTLTGTGAMCAVGGALERRVRLGDAPKLTVGYAMASSTAGFEPGRRLPIRNRPPLAPMLRMLPALPIDRMLPALPIDRMLPLEPIERMLPKLPRQATLNALNRLNTLSALYALYQLAMLRLPRVGLLGTAARLVRKWRGRSPRKRSRAMLALIIAR